MSLFDQFCSRIGVEDPLHHEQCLGENTAHGCPGNTVLDLEDRSEATEVIGDIIDRLGRNQDIETKLEDLATLLMCEQCRESVDVSTAYENNVREKVEEWHDKLESWSRRASSDGSGAQSDEELLKEVQWRLRSDMGKEFYSDLLKILPSLSTLPGLKQELKFGQQASQPQSTQGALVMPGIRHEAMSRQPLSQVQSHQSVQPIQATSINMPIDSGVQGSSEGLVCSLSFRTGVRLIGGKVIAVDTRIIQC